MLHNYFEVGVELFQDGKGFLYYAGDIALFVIAWEKNTDGNIVRRLGHNQNQRA